MGLAGPSWRSSHLESDHALKFRLGDPFGFPNFLLTPLIFNMSRSGLVVIALLVFLALHQDVWFWNDDKTLFFGFLPVGLAFHAVLTIGIAMFWGAVVMFAWPHDLEAFANEAGDQDQ